VRLDVGSDEHLSLGVMFDNTFSLIRSKSVEYRVSLVKPNTFSAAMLAVEAMILRAKGGEEDRVRCDASSPVQRVDDIALIKMSTAHSPAPPSFYLPVQDSPSPWVEAAETGEDGVDRGRGRCFDPAVYRVDLPLSEVELSTSEEEIYTALGCSFGTGPDFSCVSTCPTVKVVDQLSRGSRSSTIIAGVLKKSIAARAGLTPGLIVAEIGGQCTCGLGHVQRMRMLRRTCASISRGDPTSVLTLGVQRRTNTVGQICLTEKGGDFVEASNHDNGCGTVSVLQAIRAGIKRSQNSLHTDHIDSVNVTTKHILDSIQKSVERVVLKSFEGLESTIGGGEMQRHERLQDTRI
jgi:hypothetical protein